MTNPFSDQPDFLATPTAQENTARSKWLEEINFKPEPVEASSSPKPTKPTPHYEDVVVTGKPGEFLKLTNDSSFSVLDDGSQRITVGNSTVTVGPDGRVAVKGVGEFTIQPHEKGGQTITTPDGYNIFVEGTRIHTLSSPGNWSHREFVTPQEAADRQRQREEAREAAMQDFFRGTSDHVAQVLGNGNLPVEYLDRVFSDALYDYGGKGITDLAAKINEAVKDTGYIFSIEWPKGQNGGKIGPDLAATLRVVNSRSGALSLIPIHNQIRLYKATEQ